jgi:hypothetical protein
MENNKKIISKLLKEKLATKAPLETKKTGDENTNDSKYQKVKSLLDNDIFNHAAIMRQLGWGGKEDTNRSLFRKKLYQEPNDSGGHYEFDESELLKISDILMRTSSQIKKSVGRSGQV